MICDDLANFNMQPIYDNKINSIINYLGLEHKLWSDSDIVELLKNSFDNDVLMAYNSVRANAVKSDIARYCILYQYGGWYFDLLMSVKGPIKHNIEDGELVLFRDMAIWKLYPLSMSTSIMFAKEARHRIFEIAIEKTVYNVLNKIYPRGSHFISGPGLLGQAVAQYYLESPDSKIVTGDLSYLPNSPAASFWFPNHPEKSVDIFAYHRMDGDEALLPPCYQKSGEYDQMFNSRETYL